MGFQHLTQLLHDRWRAPHRRKLDQQRPCGSLVDIGESHFLAGHLHRVILAANASLDPHHGVGGQRQGHAGVGLGEDQHLDGGLQILDGHNGPHIAILGLFAHH